MRSSTKIKLLLALFMTGIFTVNPVFADKPELASKNKQEKNEKKWSKEEKRAYKSGQPYFNDHHHRAVNEYYGKSYRSEKCPPGLAKKNNGCVPPGQTKKWQMGKPLPREVIYHSVPQNLIIELGVPPRGHRYVRVGGDILMIAIGTSMVVDAINDLGRM